MQPSQIEWAMREDSPLWQRVAAVALKKAGYVLGEDAGEADHWARVQLAEAMLASPLNVSRAFLAEVAANGTASEAVVKATQDAIETSTVPVLGPKTDAVADSDLEYIIGVTWTDVAHRVISDAFRRSIS